MGAVGTIVLSGLKRRRLQAAVIGLVLLLASGAATLALATLVESNQPFETAFTNANGAHLVVEYTPATTASQLARTASASVVTDSAGPWPVGDAAIYIPGGGKGGGSYVGGQVSGRSNPSGGVDRMTVSEGRWWRVRGELVISDSFAQTFNFQAGQRITVQDAPPAPVGGNKPGSGNVRTTPGPATAPNLPTHTFTVVGIAASISTPGTAAWMSPADVAMLNPGTAPANEMLYRVNPSATSANIAAATASITNGLPPSAVVTTQSYLIEKSRVDRTAQIFVPILLAFSAFALLAAAFIIANVVSGIVLASYRDIGVMKAVGYTPRQVTAGLLLQILTPAVIGAGLGVAAGTVGSQPILAQTAQSFGLPASFSVSPPVVVVVLFAVLVTGILAAVGPALNAGRLSVISTLTRGAAPSPAPGWERLLRLVHALPIPAAPRLGIAAGLVGPVRAAMTAGALTVGVASLVFAVGLNTSLGVVASDLFRDHASPIRVEVDPQAPNPESITSLIASRPEVQRYVSTASRSVSMPTVGTLPFVAYRGDSSWIGYALIEGRWFARPGEAVAPTNLFRTAGLHVGDSATFSYRGRSVTLTLVGEILDQARENNDNLVIRGEWVDLASLDPSLAPTGWEIQTTPGTEPMAFASDMRNQSHGVADAQVARDSQSDEGFLLFVRVITVLGAILVTISLAGVFNMVLLETRHRARQTAILKAIGMTPRQVIGSVVASVVPVALLAGAIGVPVGLVLHHEVLDFMADAATKTRVPSSVFDVLPIWLLLVFGSGGLVIGAIGAYLPARRTARALIAPVLQSE